MLEKLKSVKIADLQPDSVAVAVLEQRTTGVSYSIGYFTYLPFLSAVGWN